MAGEHFEEKSHLSYSTSINQTQLIRSQIQNLESNTTDNMFNLSTSMEMIGFSKNLTQVGPSSSKTTTTTSSTVINGADHHHQPTTDFYHQFNGGDHHQNLISGGEGGTESGNWEDHQQHQNRLIFMEDDSSLRCVFPCEGNERPSQGLSLSLSSTHPSSIGLQSFELRHPNHHHPHQQQQAEEADLGFLSCVSREGYFGKFTNVNHHHQQEIIESHSIIDHQQAAASDQFQLRNCKYLVPAQQLLNEFCSLGTKLHSDLHPHLPNMKTQKSKLWEDSSLRSKQSLLSLDFMDLHKRKSKLFSMLEELERRYMHYCDQMKAVVSTFEAVAGTEAASVYSALASKAMSRHFRSLKDGIVSQIQATKKAMGEKDQAAPGSSKGETPRLRILDQTLRQQRAFQQMTMMEHHPWRPQRGLPERSVSILRAWLFEHFLHPYPSDVDKHILARQTGLSRSQVSNWFINARVRLWKPMVEDMYLEELKEQENSNNNNAIVSSNGIMGLDDTSQTRPEDRKPTPDQLLRINSECLSSVVTNSNKSDSKSNKIMQNHHVQRRFDQQQNQQFGRVTETFGTMELDFSSYNPHSTTTIPYASNNANQNFNSGGGGVSLTLGLQQHGGNGVSIAFSSTSQNSLFFGRDHIEDQCQPTVQYSLLDGEAQNLPYRNLMGAQLLHDLV